MAKPEETTGPPKAQRCEECVREREEFLELLKRIAAWGDDLQHLADASEDDTRDPDRFASLVDGLGFAVERAANEVWWNMPGLRYHHKEDAAMEEAVLKATRAADSRDRQSRIAAVPAEAEV